MKLTRELMSLRESHNPTEDFEDLDLWADEGLENVDVEVEYEYEAASHTDHPYGMGTAREEHPSSVGIISVKLSKDAKQYDEEGDKVVRVLTKGTDLMHEKFWKKSDEEWFVEQIHDNVGQDEDDFDEPDDYRDDAYYDDGR